MFIVVVVIDAVVAGLLLNILLFLTEYEVDGALTYEEVGLMQPNPARKRPVVLIGMSQVKLRIISMADIIASQSIQRPLFRGKVNTFT